MGSDKTHLCFKYHKSYIAKSMDSNASKSFSNVQLSACLLRITTCNHFKAIQALGTSDMLQTPVFIKADLLLLVVFYWWFVSLLIKLSIGNDNCVLSLCVYVEGFCKSGHIDELLGEFKGKSSVFINGFHSFTYGFLLSVRLCSVISNNYVMINHNMITITWSWVYI